jgi:hypothetical protein
VSQSEAPVEGLPAVFADVDSLRAWAESSSAGGGHCTEWTFGSHRLIVVLRQFTSGVDSTEPSVFAERDGVWRRLLLAETHWFAAAEVTVEGKWLVLWHHSAAGRVEWLRLNLAVALSATAGNRRERLLHTPGSSAPTPRQER